MRMEVGIFANESLLLNEVISAVEGQFPDFSVKVYTEKDNMVSLHAEVPSAQIYELSNFGEEDVLLALPGTKSMLEYAKDFDGSILDATGFYEDEEDIFKIVNPVEYVLSAISEDIGDLKGVCSLPVAIFGKDGVDDLINQTRHVLAFSDYKTKIIDFDICFNVVTEGNSLFDNYLSDIRDTIRENFIFRLLPVSTGLILDIWGNTGNVAEEDLYENAGNLTGTVANEGLVFKKNDNGMVTVYGDYLYIYTKQILDELKKL